MSSDAIDSMLFVFVVVCTLVGTLMLAVGKRNDEGMRAKDAHQQWCAATCGDWRVLSCQMVTDPAWSAPRRGVACSRDIERSTIRFVIDRGQP